ncbi:hypothetical protein TCON_1630, partial [Astathelohania contejeani]
MILREVIQKAERDKARLMILGDFNMKTIDWEAYDAGTEDFWTCRFMNLFLEAFMYQHVKQPTRMRGGDVPSVLDLIFTRKEEEIFDIQYLPPIGKSDHVLLEVKYAIWYDIEENVGSETTEKLDYKKGQYRSLREFLNGFDWNGLLLGKEINEMYDKFCEIYDKGTQIFIPKQRSKCRKQDWFNRNCERAREQKTKKWNQYRKRPNPQTYHNYKQVQN